MGRRLQRLLIFQATLEKEKGMPPSRWQRRLEFGREGEATLIKKPVSHRRKGKIRGRVEVGELEASSPKLREYGELKTSNIKSLLLHSSLYPGGWDGGGHRGFCFSCGVWGNIKLIL